MFLCMETSYGTMEGDSAEWLVRKLNGYDFSHFTGVQVLTR